MNRIWELLHEKETVVLFDVDDSDETLGRYMKETDFCTAHPMIFMEYMGTDPK